MAYDLFFKTQIPINCSRDPALGPLFNKPTAALVSVGLAVFLKEAFAKVRREGEKRHYQETFRPGHHPTLELPAMPMHDFTFGGNGEPST